MTHSLDHHTTSLPSGHSGASGTSIQPSVPSVSGFGIDPSLLGLNMPGGKDLNGSGGSDKRESLKIAQATLATDRISTLDVVLTIGELNGVDPELVPKFIDIDVSQTLDQNPTGKKTVVGA